MTGPEYQPVGVFDSGIGGLSVLRDIRRRLPREDIVYFADSAHCPYGRRPEDEIRELTIHATTFLVEQGCKLIVIACNTASAMSLSLLRELFTVPIVGLEPAFKPAAQQTRNGRVGVMATEATLRGRSLLNLRSRFGEGIQVIALPCPGLVEAIESGDTGSPEVESLLARCLSPMIEAHVDTLVLGCTHYPCVRDAIFKLMGDHVTIIDSGGAVARQVQRVLEREECICSGPLPGNVRAFTSGNPIKFGRQFQQLLGHEVSVQGVVWNRCAWEET